MITTLYGHTFDDHCRSTRTRSLVLAELFLKTISTVYYIYKMTTDENETKRRSVPYRTDRRSGRLKIRLSNDRGSYQTRTRSPDHPARSDSDGRLDSKAFFVAAAAVHVDATVAVVLSTHAVLLALQVQVVRRRRVPLAQRVADDAAAAAVLFQEPLVVVRPVDRAHHRVDGGRALLGRPPPAVFGSSRPVGLAPQAHHRCHDGNREKHHRRATQHAHVHQVHAVPARAVGWVLVEAHRAVRLTVAPELRANARVQFRAPVNTNDASPNC